MKLSRLHYEKGGTHIIETVFKTLDGCFLRTVWLNGFSAKRCRFLRDNLEAVHAENKARRSFYIPAGLMYAPRFF